MRSLLLKRILAVLAAAGLIVGAVVLRNRWDRSSNASATPPASTDASGSVVASTTPSNGGRILACVTDLAEVCNSLASATVQVRVESWTATVATLGTASAPDGWVTVSPLDALGTWAGAPKVVGSAQLVAVAATDRAAALAASCSAADTWKCVGANAGGRWTALGGQASWNRVLPGFADPNRSAIGVVGLGAATAAFLGTSDFGSTQLEASDAFFTWYQSLVSSVPVEALDDPLALLLQRPSKVSIAATTSAAFASQAGARANQYTSSYPGPMARADVVLAVRSGSGLPGDLAGLLTAALGKASWSAPVTSGPTQLPSAATLVNLAQRWKDIRK